VWSGYREFGVIVGKLGVVMGTERAMEGLKRWLSRLEEAVGTWRGGQT